VSLQVMAPRFWGASTKRWKDAGSVASGASGATEDAPARSVLAFQKPGDHCLEGHYRRLRSQCVNSPMATTERKISPTTSIEKITFLPSSAAVAARTFSIDVNLPHPAGVSRECALDGRVAAGGAGRLLEREAVAV
jgi:hypothetical protein